jgi:predicted cytidylate kinase
MGAPWSMVTVSGLPGSGTTTACGLLRLRLGWEHVNAGAIFRQLAAERGLSLAELGALAEQDGAIDRELDARMVAVARARDHVVLEGRLCGWMALRHRLPALRCWLTAPASVRAERVGGRDGQSAGAAAAAMAAREASEARRYRAFHGIDYGDLSIYPVVVDTAAHSAEQVVTHIVTRLREGAQ